MCIFSFWGIGPEVSREPLSALDCRMVRQPGLTPSPRLASPLRKLPPLSYTNALLPRHMFPVPFSMAQPRRNRILI